MQTNISAPMYIWISNSKSRAIIVVGGLVGLK